VCDGTHVVESGIIDAPVTIQPVAGANPVIRNDADTASFVVNGVSAGVVRFSDLDFENPSPTPDGGPRTSSIRAWEVYDQVIVENSSFTVSGGFASVRAGESTVPGALVSIQSSDFTGGDRAVGSGGAAVDVLNSTFNDQTDRALQYSFGTGLIQGNVMTNCGAMACIRPYESDLTVIGNTITGAGQQTALFAIYDSNVVFANNIVSGDFTFIAVRMEFGPTGRVEDNTISGCGDFACIRLRQSGAVNVIGNALTNDVSRPVQYGIWVQGGATVGWQGPFTISGNEVIGTGPVSDPNDPSSYAFDDAGIWVNGTATVAGNHVMNAAAGVRAVGTSVISAGSDNNIIEQVLEGISSNQTTQFDMHSSDITGYVMPITGDSHQSGGLTCNWWGDTNGPMGVDPAVPSDVYWPWALASVAGTSATECALEVRVATADNGSGLPYVGTLAEAVSVIAPDGRIYVSDGPHSAEGIVVDRPMTIEAETGASPVIQTGVASSGFLLDGYDVGTVVIDGLGFDVTTPAPAADGLTTYAVRGLGTYSGFIVRNSDVSVGPAASGGIAGGPSTVPATVQVENTSIEGGIVAIASNGGRLDVTNSQFTGGRALRIQYTGSTGRIEGSTFSDCGTAWCVRLRGGSNVEIVDNIFTPPTLTGDAGPDLDNLIHMVTGSTALISGNDFQGCARFDCVSVRSSTATITGNTFTHIGGQTGLEHPFVSNVIAWVGANVTVDNNIHTACGWACYKILDGSTAVIRQETVSVSPGHGTGPVLLGGRDDAASGNNIITFEDNVVTGTGAFDPGDPASYPAGEGISVWWSDVTANRNTFTAVARGVSVHTDATLTGEDNVFDQTFFAASFGDNGTANFRFNDFTNHVNPLEGGNGSDLTCNWWGDTSGPVGVDPAIPSTVYLPWALLPVAGTGATSCGGGL
jgi:hypothetical protein